MTLPLTVIEESAAERVRILRERRDRDALLVHEIYTSVQGEGTHVGLPCVFVRLSACHLRCSYCDTSHAFHQGSERPVAEVVDEVVAHGLGLVLVTGGEPLLQKATIPLLRALADRGLTVLLETSGGVTTRLVDERVRIILDVKTPGSGESERNVWENLARLRPHDEVKFVLCDDRDYLYACDVLRRHAIHERCAVLFSPAAGTYPPAELAERMVRERLPARFQIQLHKVLWGDRRGV